MKFLSFKCCALVLYHWNCCLQTFAFLTGIYTLTCKKKKVMKESLSCFREAYWTECMPCHISTLKKPFDLVTIRKIRPLVFQAVRIRTRFPAKSIIVKHVVSAGASVLYIIVFCPCVSYS